MPEQILDEGLADYVAMDVKNSPEKYAQTCGVEAVDLGVIRQSIDLIRSKAPDYEFRTTVVKELHEQVDIEAVARGIEGAKRYFLQCFTDRDTVPFAGFHAPSKEDLERFAEAAKRFVPATEIRGV